MVFPPLKPDIWKKVGGNAIPIFGIGIVQKGHFAWITPGSAPFKAIWACSVRGQSDIIRHDLPPKDKNIIPNLRGNCKELQLAIRTKKGLVRVIV